jgi:hypothetical protein
VYSQRVPLVCWFCNHHVDFQNSHGSTSLQIYLANNWFRKLLHPLENYVPFQSRLVTPCVLARLRGGSLATRQYWKPESNHCRHFLYTHFNYITVPYISKNCQPLKWNGPGNSSRTRLLCSHSWNSTLLLCITVSLSYSQQHIFLLDLIIWRTRNTNYSLHHPLTSTLQTLLSILSLHILP